MNKELTKEEIEKLAIDIVEEWKNDYNDNSNSNFIKNIINLIDQNTKPLIDEINKLKASKSEDNEAVEFMDWVIKNEYYFSVVGQLQWRILVQRFCKR